VSEIYLRRAPRLAARRVEGEMIILAADDSRLFVLNEVAAAIWEAADGCSPLSAIVERVVCRDFEVDAETGLRDAREFVEQLASQRVLQVSPVPFEADGEARRVP
jgi:hypothetical protein